jgi:hypothetical protein
MVPNWKSPLTCASLLLFSLFAIGVSEASECKSIHTDITSTFTNGPACPSPVGICTTGALASGLLKGTTSFIAIALAAAPAPSTQAYTGTLSITTDQGKVTISDVGVLDQSNAVFSEFDRIESGSGRFSDATGILFISGNQTATGFEGEVTGDICLVQ